VSLLAVSDLRGGYGPVRVLHGIDLHVEAGEIVVVLGANGSGKTSTLRAISGMMRATGSVRIGDHEVLGRHPEFIARQRVAHVPQGRGTFPELTVEENLRIGAFSRRDKDVAADIDRWCTLFPRLKERRNQQAGSMSGGEQQMLAVSRALMMNPRLLLLDEPSLGLAPLVTQELFGRLAELNAQTSIAMLIVEQNANLALRIAARGYVLEAGEIVASGSSQELASNDEIRKAYLGMA
jgi:branched-chain amino acid transport system ATP-binding protein